jgi:hypothetical protein
MIQKQRLKLVYFLVSLSGCSAGIKRTLGVYDISFS